jgi:hypothetical protein
MREPTSVHRASSITNSSKLNHYQTFQSLLELYIMARTNGAQRWHETRPI